MRGKITFENLMIIITISICFLIFFLANYQLQVELNQTKTLLSECQNSLKFCNSSLNSCRINLNNSLQTLEIQRTRIENLTSQIADLSQNFKALKEKYENLSENIDLEKKKYEKLKEKYENLYLEHTILITEKGAIRPTYQQLVDFVNSDNTNEKEWSEDFDCTEFSNTFINNFRKRGFFACTAELDLSDNETLGGHIIVAVSTVDRGLYYVEPQSDNIIPAKELKIGANYCDIVNWNCNWIIEKISSCFDLKNI